jgi:epoxide hydrolase
MSAEITPFRIAATDSELDDLKRRLRDTRWPERECVDDWSQGLPLAYAQEVCAYWLKNYDWRRGEARLNRFPQFKTIIDGLAIHFFTFVRLIRTPCRCSSVTAGRARSSNSTR